MTRCIIMAAGEGTRWGDYTGSPKHLISPDNSGEALLSRLVRQLAERGEDDVIVIGPESYQPYVGEAKLDSRNEIGDSEEFVGSTKFANTIPHWDPEGRTVIFYGDTWFTDEALTTILGNTERCWINWCRLQKSEVTGATSGENFAVSFYPGDHARYEMAIIAVAEARKRGHIKRAGGWEISRAMDSPDRRQWRVHKHRSLYRYIDDFTEDFDKPADLDMWRERYSETYRSAGFIETGECPFGHDPCEVESCVGCASPTA